MVIDAAISGALMTAACGLIAAIIAKLRCRFLVDNKSDEGIDWSCARGFTEIKLPQPDSSKTVEAIPLQCDTLYVKKSD